MKVQEESMNAVSINSYPNEHPYIVSLGLIGLYIAKQAEYGSVRQTEANI